MSYVGVTTKEYESQLLSLGMTVAKPEDFDGIPTVSQVFIYDRDGIFSQSYLRAVVTKGNSLVYCFLENGEQNTQFLSTIGVYNCYENVDPQDVTADFIQDKFKRKNTLQDVQHILQHNSKITAFNLNLTNLDSFLQAIDNKDKSAIVDLFEKSFDNFKDIRYQIDSKLTEIEKLHHDLLVSDNEKTDLQSKIETLSSKYNQILRDGRTVEQDNKQLAEALQNLDLKLQERDRALATANERANNLQTEMAHKDSKITDLSNKLIETSNVCNTLKINNESLTKQLHTVSSSITNNFSSDKIKLQLSNTGTVNKILYIKVIDPVPYLVSSLLNFPLYISNIRKMQKGCVMVLITPQDSTIYEQYSATNPIINDSAKYENCSGKMFVMEGFNTALEKFVQNCNCDACIILDMTFKTAPLTESFKQKNIYIINNDETIERYILNPKECFSYNTDISNNIAGFIPNLSQEELNVTYKGQKKLKDNLYSVLDALWG